MSQYPGFEGFRHIVNYDPNMPTPPAAFLTAPPAVSKHLATTAAAGYRSFEQALPSSSIPPRPVSQPSADKDSALTLHERLLVVQDAMQWMIRNQHQLLERLDAVLRKQERLERGQEAAKASVAKLSETVHDFKHKVGSEVDMSACDECADEEDQYKDRYTDAIVDNDYLRHC
jgi:hypothetical protein